MASEQFNRREPKVVVWILVPYTILLNLLIFGGCIFSSWTLFFKSFLYSDIYFVIVYLLFGVVAANIHKRFPEASDLFKRIAVMLPVFYAMNALSISILFFIYTQWGLVSCPVITGNFVWSILYGCTTSTVITFINEGIANFEAWKTSLTETEKLKNAYRRSRVYGLRGQINPHFLFNCFNTLSGLIEEDEVKADNFLNEMTKVHRYLLQSDDELLVPLDTEMKFANSYLYLAKERFGEALQITVSIDDDALDKFVPPLSMQVILENIIYTNALHKTDPLRITISSAGDMAVAVTNTLHKKNVVQADDLDDGLDNLFMKYRMLNSIGIAVQEENNERRLVLPLFNEKEVKA